MERILIAERGTDWLRALRSLSLAQRPFTTLVQARDDADFLRDRPWNGVPPREIVLLCGAALTREAVSSRLSLFRHVVSTARPDQTSLWIVSDSDEGEMANRAFLDVVQELAPGFDVRRTSLQELTERQVDAA